WPELPRLGYGSDTSTTASRGESTSTATAAWHCAGVPIRRIFTTHHRPSAPAQSPIGPAPPRSDAPRPPARPTPPRWDPPTRPTGPGPHPVQAPLTWVRVRTAAAPGPASARPGAAHSWVYLPGWSICLWPDRHAGAGRSSPAWPSRVPAADAPGTAPRRHQCRTSSTRRYRAGPRPAPSTTRPGAASRASARTSPYRSASSASTRSAGAGSPRPRTAEPTDPPLEMSTTDPASPAYHPGLARYGSCGVTYSLAGTPAGPTGSRRFSYR